MKHLMIIVCKFLNIYAVKWSDVIIYLEKLPAIFGGLRLSLLLFVKIVLKHEQVSNVVDKLWNSTADLLLALHCKLDM